jgi:hypothetical protein
MLVGLLGGGMVGAYHNDFLESRDLDLAITCGWVVIGSVAGLALFAFVCAITGLASARFHGQPIGLSLAGVIASVAALALAVVLFLGGLRTAEWLRWLQQHRFGPAAPDQLHRAAPR